MISNCRCSVFCILYFVVSIFSFYCFFTVVAFCCKIKIDILYNANKFNSSVCLNNDFVLFLSVDCVIFLFSSSSFVVHIGELKSHILIYYSRRRVAGVRRSSPSVVCVCVCVCVCPQHNSKTNDPRVFKLRNRNRKTICNAHKINE